MKTSIRLLLLAVVFGAGAAPAAERIPPAPPRYFNDYAGVVSPPVAEELNRVLEQFERESSNQLLVVLYPRMESDSSVEDYTVRVAQAWRVGQAKRNNGAVLFAFMQERQLYIQVGYGLEARLTDALAKRIIEREIVPRFRRADIDGGMRAAVETMIAATKGEYGGTGKTVAETRRGGTATAPFIAAFIAIVAIALFIQLLRKGLQSQPTVILGPRRRTLLDDPTWWTGGGSTRSGGSSWGGSSWGGGSGGGFSGGGGSFGGGGAGGKW